MLYKNFSPGSFSDVSPPDKLPDVNLYFVSIFQGEPNDVEFSIPGLMEKFVINVLLHLTASDLIFILSFRAMYKQDYNV